MHHHENVFDICDQMFCYIVCVRNNLKKMILNKKYNIVLLPFWLLPHTATYCRSALKRCLLIDMNVLLSSVCAPGSAASHPFPRALLVGDEGFH